MKKKILTGLLCLTLAAAPSMCGITAFAAGPPIVEQEFHAEAVIASGDDDSGSEGEKSARVSADTARDTTAKKLVVSEDKDENAALGLALGIVLYIAQIFGGALFIYGIVKYFQAVQRDMPMLKNTAMISIVTGAMLFCMYTLLKAAGFIS